MYGHFMRRNCRLGANASKIDRNHLFFHGILAAFFSSLEKCELSAFFGSVQQVIVMHFHRLMGRNQINITDLKSIRLTFLFCLAKQKKITIWIATFSWIIFSQNGLACYWPHSHGIDKIVLSAIGFAAIATIGEQWKIQLFLGRVCARAHLSQCTMVMPSDISFIMVGLLCLFAFIFCCIRQILPAR